MFGGLCENYRESEISRKFKKFDSEKSKRIVEAQRRDRLLQRWFRLLGELFCKAVALLNILVHSDTPSPTSPPYCGLNSDEGTDTVIYCAVGKYVLGKTPLLHIL
jgi:hypothetical protein